MRRAVNLRHSIAAVLLGAAFVVLTPACATRPAQPQAWYDFHTVWHNDRLGGEHPWRKRDRAAVRAALVERELDAARAEVARLEERLAQERKIAGLGPAPRRDERERCKQQRRVADRDDAGDPRDEGRPPARRTTTSTTKRAPPASKEPRPASKRSRRDPVPARIARSRPAPAPAPAERPVLGDGSMPSELVAAARRLLGIQDGFSDDSLLRHLLSATGVDLDVEASVAEFDAKAWGALHARGLAHPKGPLAPGDIVFFHGVRDLDGNGVLDDAYSLVAVVETVRDSGVAVCIGEVYGEVRRFPVDPARPHVLRDEATGEEVNEPLRRRALSDRPSTPILSGELLAGYVRF